MSGEALLGESKITKKEGNKMKMICENAERCPDKKCLESFEHPYDYNICETGCNGSKRKTAQNSQIRAYKK